jgi:hypothetical protein
MAGTMFFLQGLEYAFPDESRQQQFSGGES